MNNVEALAKLVDKVLAVSKSQFKELEAYVDALEKFNIPVYGELKDPEFFLQTNTFYTQLSTTNHFYKVKISKLNIDITTLVNEITKYKLSSTTQNLLTELKKAKDKSALYKETLEEHQKSIDAVLKHLQLCSYTMNSPYME